MESYLPCVLIKIKEFLCVSSCDKIGDLQSQATQLQVNLAADTAKRDRLLTKQKMNKSRLNTAKSGSKTPKTGLKMSS